MAPLTPDPLCRSHDDGWDLIHRPPCVCRALYTARLQGPLKDNRHAPICWCPQCLQASDDIHGTAV